MIQNNHWNRLHSLYRETKIPLPYICEIYHQRATKLYFRDLKNGVPVSFIEPREQYENALLQMERLARIKR